MKTNDVHCPALLTFDCYSYDTTCSSMYRMSIFKHKNRTTQKQKNVRDHQIELK